MTRHVVAFLSVVSLVAASCALAASGGASAAMAAMAAPAPPAATGTWGNAEPVPGLPIAPPNESGLPEAWVQSVSCTAPGDCSAGGSYFSGASQGQAFVVDEKRGTWGKAQIVAGAAGPLLASAVSSLSCGSPGNCAAGGYYGNGYHAFIVNEKNGTWGKAMEVPGLAALDHGNALLSSVSCGRAGDCTGGGFYEDSSHNFQGFVVDEKDGTWGTVHPVPPITGLTGAGYMAEVVSVSCPSPGYCSAGGWAGAAARQAFVMDETNGTWGNASVVPSSAALNVGGDATVNSMSCDAIGECTVGGYYAASVGGRYTVDRQAFVADEAGGTWHEAREVPGTAALNVGNDAQVLSVSCTSPDDCLAGGVYSTTPGDIRGQAAYQRGFVVSETGGTWGKAQQLPGVPGQVSAVNSVSCSSPGDCVAGGHSGNLLQDREKAVVADETRGIWGTARLVPGMTAIAGRGFSDVRSVSCVSATDCAAGGIYEYGVNGDLNAFVVDKSVHVPTVTVVKLSAPTVAYGNERAEHVFVTVSAGSGGTPAGKVTVKAGSTTVCAITLESGKGSCALSAGRFPAGTVKVTASYGGSFAFGGSVSAVTDFTVLKAATKTRLALSAAKVRYGHEQSEKISVSVSPRYAGTVPGKVTVKAGSATVCVITLKSGKGSCALAARQLRAGTYTLTATYPGSRNFARSAAARKALTVVS